MLVVQKNLHNQHRDQGCIVYVFSLFSDCYATCFSNPRQIMLNESLGENLVVVMINK